MCVLALAALHNSRATAPCRADHHSWATSTFSAGSLVAAAMTAVGAVLALAWLPARAPISAWRESE